MPTRKSATAKADPIKKPTPKAAPKKPAAKKTTPKIVHEGVPAGQDAQAVSAAPIPPEAPAPALEPIMEPQPLPAPAVPDAPAGMMSVGDERTWAMLSHLSVLLNLVTGILGPIAAIIIYAVYKDRSRYVAYHAMQSFVNQLVWWTGGVALASVFWAIGFALSPVIVGFFCMPVACVFTLMPIVAIVYGIIGGVQTSQGQDFKYWLVGDWTRGTLTG